MGTPGVAVTTLAATGGAGEAARDVLRGISSMATRSVLAELCRAAERAGMWARFESIGGVDAAHRVRAGEAFDVLVLAADAIDALAVEGHVVAASRRALMTSEVAIAVPIGAPRPDVGSVAALRAAVRAAARIGYSTGPSGAALVGLFERWGLAGQMRDKLVQAPPGTPVAALLASGRVDLGFQQLSEFQDERGIALLGVMPPGAEIVTSFVAAVGTRSTHIAAATDLLDFFASTAAAEPKRRHGMAEPRSAAATSAGDRP